MSSRRTTRKRVGGKGNPKPPTQPLPGRKPETDEEWRARIGRIVLQPIGKVRPV